MLFACCFSNITIDILYLIWSSPMLGMKVMMKKILVKDTRILLMESLTPFSSSIVNDVKTRTTRQIILNTVNSRYKYNL